MFIIKTPACLVPGGTKVGTAGLLAALQVEEQLLHLAQPGRVDEPTLVQNFLSQRGRVGAGVQALHPDAANTEDTQAGQLPEPLRARAERAEPSASHLLAPLALAHHGLPQLTQDRGLHLVLDHQSLLRRVHVQGARLHPPARQKTRRRR